MKNNRCRRRARLAHVRACLVFEQCQGGATPFLAFIRGREIHANDHHQHRRNRARWEFWSGRPPLDTYDIGLGWNGCSTIGALPQPRGTGKP